VEYSDLTLMSLLAHSLHALPVLQVHSRKVTAAPQQQAGRQSVHIMLIKSTPVSAPSSLTDMLSVHSQVLDGHMLCWAHAVR
jgi:hypothetical protein